MHEIRKALAQMVESDQRARTNENVSLEKLNEVDRRNTARLKDIVSKHGWITVTKFGKDASNHAFFLVQHADLDPEFQQTCLELMSRLPEVPKKHIAYLTDRVMANKEGRQRYGTQFEDMGEYIVLRPVEDLSNLDSLREGMGLEPIDEYLAIHAESTGVPVYKSLDDVALSSS